MQHRKRLSVKIASQNRPPLLFNQRTSKGVFLWLVVEASHGKNDNENIVIDQLIFLIFLLRSAS